MHAVKDMLEGKGSTKKDNIIQSSGGGGSSSSRKTTPGRVSSQEQQQAEARAGVSVNVNVIIRCPRCDSENTKFCYYNNYSLTQPRHFCKTCRRYWTNGGALRNVPIGGGCRKNKKLLFKSSAASLDSSSSSSLKQHHHHHHPTHDINFVNGLKFFQGFSSPPPTDFQLGGGGGVLLHTNNNQFTSSPFGMMLTSSGLHPIANSTSPLCFNTLDHPLSTTTNTSSLMGSCFNYPLFSSSSSSKSGGVNNIHHQSTPNNLANSSSIESLSSLNQDLHWKLQQQRMATMLYGTTTTTQKESKSNSNNFLGSINETSNIEKPQPILFQNLEASKGREGKVAHHNEDNSSSANGNLATEWYFDPAPTSSTNRNQQENVNTWDGDGIQAWTRLFESV